MDANINKHRPILWASAIGLGTIVIAIAGSCGAQDDITAERERHARTPGESIIIAAAWPWSVREDGLYWQGLQLAADEINGNGGILGRRIKLKREDDKESVNEGRLVAQRLANDPEIVAVIGHLNSHVSIPAAPIYEASGLLMINPGSTSPELTRRGHRLIFRSVNSDEDIAYDLAAFAQKQGYHRIVIGYVRNAYGLGLANAFEQYAQSLGLAITDRQSYDPAASSHSASYQRLVDQWLDLDFDALFLAGMAPQAGYLVKQVRKSGLTAPIIGGDALDTPELIDAAGPASEGMVVATIFHADDPGPEVQRFVQSFTAAYGRPPDSWAARGYEALRMLADAMTRAGSTVPREVAKQLRFSDDSYSLSGPVGFNDQGDIVGRDVVRTVVRNGRFAYLDAIALRESITTVTTASDSSSAAGERTGEGALEWSVRH